MFNDPKPVELTFTFAVGVNGNAIVMKCDSEFLEQELTEIGPLLEDLGVEYPDKPGIYNWSGIVTFKPNGGYECPNEGFDVEYKATSVTESSWLVSYDAVLNILKGGK